MSSFSSSLVRHHQVDSQRLGGFLYDCKPYSAFSKPWRYRCISIVDLMVDCVAEQEAGCRVRLWMGCVSGVKLHFNQRPSKGVVPLETSTES